MKKYLKIIVLIALAVTLIGMYIPWIGSSDEPVPVPYQYVSALNGLKDTGWDYWFLVNDLRNTEISAQYMSQFCAMDELEMDFETHTYIFVHGYELVDLYYKTSDCRGRYSSNPLYYGYATLQKAADDQYYVYQFSNDVPVIKDDHAHYNDDLRTTILDEARRPCCGTPT